MGWAPDPGRVEMMVAQDAALIASDESCAGLASMLGSWGYSMSCRRKQADLDELLQVAGASLMTMAP